MKKIVFFLLLVSSDLFGQKSEFTLSGFVSDCEEKYPISDVEVLLLGSDGSEMKTKTDSTGYYLFSEGFTNNTHYALTTHADPNIGKGPAVKYGLCPSVSYDGVAAYRDIQNKNSFHYVDDIKSIQYDFCLEKGNVCVWIRLPEFHFKKNSTDFEFIDWIDSTRAHDVDLDCLAAALIARKSWVIEIAGHASSDEENKEQLAEARAKKIYDLLVARTIHPERLKYKGYSDKQLFEFQDEMGKVVKKSKKITNEKSKRVVLGVIRRDYDPVTRKPKVDPGEEKRLKELEEE